MSTVRACVNGAGGGDGRARYPFVRLRGPLALIGVNSCVATGDLGAWGEVGAEQLARLEALLAHPEVARRIRVVLIHHPPVMHKGGEARNLQDRDALAAVLARAGADIVLHGHDHRDERAELAGPGGRASRSSALARRRTPGGPGSAPATTSTRSTRAAAITLVTRAHERRPIASRKYAARSSGPRLRERVRERADLASRGARRSLDF